MRLIDTNTLELKDFREHPLEYAVLSHVWAIQPEEEITLQDIRSPQDSSGKQGWAKVKGFCDLARHLGYDYGWDDTCCIDRSSEVDVAKSIQSMYTYYAEAGKCIVYLEDVGPGKKSFKESVWFTRGWTLQELVAPNDVTFYDYQWTLLGNKRELVDEVSEITGIPHAVLIGTIRPQQCSVAQRMSWAAGRMTTEPEDRAYSLKGLFDVVLSVQYGERLESAFFRLQTEIIKDSSDESIFAWQTPTVVTPNSDHHQRYFGLLAPSPDCFALAQTFVSTTESKRFSYGNGVLSIPLQVRPHGLEFYLALIDVVEKGRTARFGMLLGRLSAENRFCRLADDQAEPKMEDLAKSFKTRQIEIPQRPNEAPLNLFPGFWLRQLEPPGYQVCQPVVISRASASFEDRIVLSSNQYGTTGVVCMVPHEQNPNRTYSAAPDWSQVRWLKFGFDDKFNPVCMVASTEVVRHRYVNLNQQLLDEALSTPLDSDQRSSLRIFRDHWIPADDEVIPKETTWCQGYVVMKGSRESGLDVTINAIGLRILITKVPDKYPSSSSDAAAANPRLVWTVDVQSMPIVGRSASDSSFSWCTWCFFGICDCLTCAMLSQDVSMVNKMSKIDAQGPAITYREGHHAWR